VYKFQCQIAEIHDQYHVQSLLFWQAQEGEEYVAGDSFTRRVELEESSGEHDDIMTLLAEGLSRISRKYDRTLF